MAYGLATRDAGGNLEIYGMRKLTRLIKTLHIGYSYSGDISVPEFDDTIGAITFYPKFMLFYQGKTSPFPITRQPYGTVPDERTYRFTTSTSQMPTFVWNNATKFLTVTAATDHGGSSERPDYVLNMVHYK